MKEFEIQVDWNKEQQIFVARLPYTKEYYCATDKSSSIGAQLNLAEMLEKQEDRKFIPVLIGLVKDNEKLIFQEIGLMGLNKFIWGDNKEDKAEIKLFLEEFGKTCDESFKDDIESMLEEL